MRRFPVSWSRTLAQLGLKRKRNARRRNGSRSRRPRFEPLESRHMLSAAAGDYDLSGVVEQDDYAVWKNAFGSTTAAVVDGNGDGTVNAADYVVWRDKLGATAQAGAIEDHVALDAGILSLYGTVNDDVITVTEDEVTIDGIGTLEIDVASATEIRVHIFAGDDEVSIDSAIIAPASIFGLAGDDTLSGSSGNDTIDGGEGVPTTCTAATETIRYSASWERIPYSVAGVTMSCGAATMTTSFAVAMAMTSWPAAMASTASRAKSATTNTRSTSRTII